MQPFAKRFNFWPGSVTWPDDQPVGQRRIQPQLGERLHQVARGQAVRHQRATGQRYALASQRGLGDLVGLVQVQPALGFKPFDGLCIKPPLPRQNFKVLAAVCVARFN